MALGTVKVMNWALAISSIALVIATVVLGLFTYRLWRETRAARQPRLVASLDFVAPNYGEVRLVNAGTGAATHIEVTLQPAGGQARRWTESVLLSGEGVNFKLVTDQEDSEHPKTQSDLERFIEVFGQLHVQGTYHDVVDKEYPIDQTIDVGETWGQTKQAVQLRAYRGPLLFFYQEVVKIRETLQKLIKD